MEGSSNDHHFGQLVLSQQSSSNRQRLVGESSSFDDEDDAIDSEESDIILSIMWFSGMLGAAFYDVNTAEMQLMPDQIDASPSFTILHTLLRQVEPSYIIVSSKTDDRIISILKDFQRETKSTNAESSGSGNNSLKENFVNLQSSLDYSYESCKFRLQHIELPSMAGKISEQEKRIYMNTLIDFNKTCMVRAAGGLLKFLEKRRIRIELENSNMPSVSRLCIFTLKNIVAIDDSTFSALQLLPPFERRTTFQKEMTVKTKEKLSLYGIFNRCKTFIGRKELRRWFLQPTNDTEVLSKRHQVIEYFIAGQNVEILQSLQAALRNIKIMHTILARMRKAQATIYDWQRLYRTAYNAMLIGDMCRSISADIELFEEIAKEFSPNLFKIASLIYTIVDFDESFAKNHFSVKPGIDDQLDQKKRTYNGLPYFMTQVAQRELQNLQEDIQECSVMYIPQLGYLLAIPETKNMKENKDYSLQDLQYMFMSNGVAYYKSKCTLELDRLLGDTLCEITDDETEIMHKLQNVILDMSEVLYCVMKYCAQLDCLISLAVIAKELNFTKPEISENGIISVSKGRHPLQELCISAFVPNDIYSSEAHGKIKVITGPNSSGKSIYLKQVAVIVYLAHIGSFVPAEKAKITLVDSIYSRIQVIESVSVNMSGFCQELAQVSKALINATGKSLVIIDEFGKGTNSDSGVALLASALMVWLKRGSSCPHVFLSTHFHTLHEYLPTHCLLKFQTMETMINKNEVISLYKITDGKAHGSFARNVACSANIPKSLLQREEQVSEFVKKGVEITPRDAQRTEEQYKKFTLVTRTIFEMNVDSSTWNITTVHQLLSTCQLHTPGTNDSKSTSVSVPRTPVNESLRTPSMQNLTTPVIFPGHSFIRQSQHANIPASPRAESPKEADASPSSVSTTNPANITRIVPPGHANHLNTIVNTLNRKPHDCNFTSLSNNADDMDLDKLDDEPNNDIPPDSPLYNLPNTEVVSLATPNNNNDMDLVMADATEASVVDYNPIDDNEKFYEQSSSMATPPVGLSPFPAITVDHSAAALFPNYFFRCHSV